MTGNEMLPPTYQHLSITGSVRSAMSRHPGKQALKHGTSKRSYKQLIDRADRISNGFIHDLKLSSNDHAAIVSSNSIEYMEIILGASQAGIAMATINPKLSPVEIQLICNDVEAKVLFVDESSAEYLRDVHFETIVRVITINNELEEWINLSKPINNLPVIQEWDTFTIPYTSGTTGKPKGVLVPHRSRILQLFGMAAEYGCYSPDDRFLAIAPMCHGAGMIFALAPIFFGGYAEIKDEFDPEDIVTTLKKEKITGFFGVPTHFHGILGLGNKLLEANKPTSLKTIISNAAALPQSIKEEIVGIYGDNVLHETYGSTEGGIISNLRPADQLRKLQCVGQPFPCTNIKVVNESGHECNPNEVGEIFSSSPYLFNGYWKRPKETEEALDSDGWLTVGDLAKKDDEGYLYIVDRKKDMVISGGINIYPREIEEILFQHPDVIDAAVIGVPDEKWGEALKAFLVTKDDGELSVDAINQFCKGKIAKIKMPRKVSLIDAIPRNAGGKVLKTTLRKLD